MLFHHKPCHRLSKRRSGQRTCVCPIVIDVLRKETCRVELGKLYQAILGEKGWEYYIKKKIYATRLTTLIPQFPKYPSLRFLISVYDSQQCQCVQNTVFDALPCVWLLARHPPVSVDPRASFQSVKIPNQISFLLQGLLSLKIHEVWE